MNDEAPSRHPGLQSRATLVVPCYNEAGRLNVDAFVRFIGAGGARFVFVDDGSRDETLRVLESIAATSPANVRVLTCAQNAGKGEAVRRGLLAALESETPYVGFWDADLATPLDALPGFVDRMDRSPEVEAVIGARVKLLGRSIERRAARHYFGRVFATFASLSLQIPVYDTQCGAKLFRSGPSLRQALATPFSSRWVFDVELLARLGLRGGRYDGSRLLTAVVEHPLQEWRDVGESKLKGTDFVRAAFDLWRIYRFVRRGQP